tara:strand:- start:200 stop:421 length:222 start_codon:yes stop_codon:yes gene_type:complete
MKKTSAEDDQQMNIRAEEQNRKEYLRKQKEFQARQQLPLGAKSQSPKAIQRALEQLGISDQPTWEQLSSKGQD